MQRVVVTGLGAVTPLGLGEWTKDSSFENCTLNDLGAQRSWTRLLDSQCGIVSLASRGKAHTQQQCQVAGLVPHGKKEHGGWTAAEWLSDDVRQRRPKMMVTSESEDGIDSP